jgi:hypothetical protein
MNSKFITNSHKNFTYERSRENSQTFQLLDINKDMLWEFNQISIIKRAIDTIDYNKI